MTESIAEIRNRLRRSQQSVRVAPVAPVSTASPAPVSAVAQAETHSSAFAIEDAGKTIIATAVEMSSAQSSDFYLDFRGRLVEAERANGNGAFWTQGDLQFGLPSVAYGPLNWGHDPKAVVGTLLDPYLVSAEQAAASGLGPHIQTGARFWSYLDPSKANALRSFIEQGRAWLSMECIAQGVECVGPNGCGRMNDYIAATNRTKDACEHVRERSSWRRMFNPVFQGAAVIVPPQRPGWANAEITEVVQQAERQLEAASAPIDGLSDEDAVAMVTSILQWSRRSQA